MNKTEGLMALNAVHGIGNSRLKKLIDYFGSAENVFKADRCDLLACGSIPEDVVENLLKFPRDRFLEKETVLIKKHDVSVVCFDDPAYPAMLQTISDRPSVLYIKGQLPNEMELSMAIVGSRKASLYGLSMAEKFSRELAELGFTIISGMARGVDTYAHRGALRAKGTTVAVLGSGLAEIYPPENQELFYQIAASGAVLSEFPMTTIPLPVNFPRRNRIVSGLSLGVLIVEASQKSGALITADCALEQGKEVFALPGPIDSAQSFGVNNLIKQGAKLVCSKEDILEELNPQILSILKPQPKFDDTIQTATPITDAEEKILKLLKHNPVHWDEIVQMGFLDVQEASKILLDLELKNMVKQLPGKFFAVQTK